MAVTFFDKWFRDVILLQNVENLVVFACKNTAFFFQQYILQMTKH